MNRTQYIPLSRINLMVINLLKRKILLTITKKGLLCLFFFLLRNERAASNFYKVLSEMFGLCENSDCCLSLISF